jgi:hypothetical protein
LQSHVLSVSQTLNEFSSDGSKALLNATRQTLVPGPRRLDYGFRAVSTVPSQLMQEGIRRYHRGVISPVVASELFPKANGFTMEGSEALYPHLRKAEMEALLPYTDLNYLGSLQDALTDDGAGKRFDKLPYMLNQLAYQAKDPHKANQWHGVTFDQETPLAKHLRWTLAFKKTLQDLTLEWGVLPPSEQTLPFFEPQQLASNPLEAKRHCQSVLAALGHVEALGLQPHFAPLHQYLVMAGRGDFTPAEALRRNTNTPALLPLARRQLLGKTSAKELEHEALRQWFEYLWSHTEPVLSPEALAAQLAKPPAPWNHHLTPAQRTVRLQKAYVKDVTSARWGRPSEWELIKTSLWQQLRAANTATTQSPQALEAALTGLLNQLQSPSVQAQGRPPVALRFDAKNKLGLQDHSRSAFLRQSATALLQLGGVLQQAQQATAAYATPKQWPQHTAFQQQHQGLLQQFEAAYLQLAMALPGAPSQADNAPQLAHIMSKGVQDPLHRFFTHGLRSELLVKHRLPLIIKSSVMPQLLTQVVQGVAIMGVFWNFMDTNYVQPYEDRINQKKGDVVNSGWMLAFGAVPGLAVYLATLNSGALRSVLHNNPLTRFAVASVAGLAVETAFTLWLVNAYLNSKPNIKKLKEEPLGQLRIRFQQEEAHAKAKGVAAAAVEPETPRRLSQTA